MSRVARQSTVAYTPDASVLNIVEELTIALRFAGLPDPRRVATDILAALLEVPRSWPTMNRESAVDTHILASAREAARRLGAGAPFAYAVGSAQFRHLNLSVDSRVLIPRPETEVLVGEVLERMDARFKSGEAWGTAVDIGTGSGAIALCLASEGRFDKVIATDVSLDALDVARSNAVRSAAALRCDVEFRRGSLLAPVRDVRATVLVSNPPYIAFSELDALPASVRDWEPPLALASGHNGMAATAKIVSEGSRILVSGGILALEVDERRASLVAELVMGHGGYADVGVRLDLAGRERFVLASRT
ncbi:MAG TPA: peptide chain release factor N(5)-glutamine methyltransferase [Gemmatimonadaceae bacterium]|nr:peptide chain release factor N(5)-glutamine methyltransferase [Gemmatimonadaceae bacterium]